MRTGILLGTMRSWDTVSLLIKNELLYQACIGLGAGAFFVYGGLDVGYECHHIMLGLEIKRAYLKKSDICAIIYAVFLYLAVRRATYHIHYR